MCKSEKNPLMLATKPIKIKKPGQPCIDIPCGPDCDCEICCIPCTIM